MVNKDGKLKKLGERGLRYRVAETSFDGKRFWVPQYKKNGSWRDCRDDNGGVPFRDTPREARHWLYWETEKYPDAGSDEQPVFLYDLNGSRVDGDGNVIVENLRKTGEGRGDASKLEPQSKYPIRELFVCDCGDVSHQFVVSIDPDPEWQHVAVEVKLNRNLPWWKRLCVAFRYLFLLTPSRFGDYDEVLLSGEHAESLQRVVMPSENWGGENE